MRYARGILSSVRSNGHGPLVFSQPLTKCGILFSQLRQAQRDWQVRDAKRRFRAAKAARKEGETLDFTSA